MDTSIYPRETELVPALQYPAPAALPQCVVLRISISISDVSGLARAQSPGLSLALVGLGF